MIQHGHLHAVGFCVRPFIRAIVKKGGKYEFMHAMSAGPVRASSLDAMTSFPQHADGFVETQHFRDVHVAEAMQGMSTADEGEGDDPDWSEASLRVFQAWPANVASGHCTGLSPTELNIQVPGIPGCARCWTVIEFVVVLVYCMGSQLGRSWFAGVQSIPASRLMCRAALPRDWKRTLWPKKTTAMR